MATYGGFPWMDQPPPSTDLHAGGELEQQIAPKRYGPGSYNSRWGDDERVAIQIGAGTWWADISR
ncbi:MAG: hypothetical protein A2029_03705 [Chloroflexi bacterium RBG_19FT_COMBO_47_9]|nr:MAG: hypothetical protein A2029_03705 [Chloroflexi bacterium RBG_19FT_COMBO_47_9]